MLNIIAFIIFISSLALIALIIAKKMPILREIKFEEVLREKHKKRFLLEERLKRKFQLAISKISRRIPSIKSAARLPGELRQYYKNLQDIKNAYWKKFTKQKNSADDLPFGEEDEAKLLEAKELLNTDKFEDAEKAALYVIKENPKSLHAYKLLAEIYLKSKNFLHAEATWEHVVKLAQRLKNVSASHYLQLAETKLKLEKVEDALQNAKKAVTLEPSNPKMLHFITKICIMAKQKELGWKYYLKLKKNNPANEGLDQLLQELKGVG